jgi:GNAT superfamily N-acetyltransferase
VFVVADSEDNIVGYYALTAITVDASDISADKASKLFGKFGAVPATLLSFLGVDQRWQGQGIGKMLLADALRRSLAASRQVGSFCVVLDVLDDGDPRKFAKRLAPYEGVGFRRCDTDKGVRMFLPMRDIEESSR